MRAKEFIIEGSGLKSARPGEVYKDQQGTEYKFQSWNWQFPAEDIAYPDLTGLQAAVEEITGHDANKITWVNKPTTRTKSFAYAVFASDDGKELWIGKYFIAKNPNNTILDKEVKQFLGLSAGGAGAVKAEASLQPVQLGLADGRSRNLNGIIKTVGAHSQGPMLVNALNAAASNQSIVFKGGAGIAGALQDDFCEVLAPVAMMSSNSIVVGQLNEAVKDVFKGADISGSSISFPGEQNNPLIDSYIVNSGITLGVSHKGKQGAKATITNIWKAKEEAAQTPTGQAYIKKYQRAVSILDICKEESGIQQPITLGQALGLLKSSESQALMEAMQNPRDPKYRLTGDPRNPNAVIRQATPEDAAKVPPALRRLFNMGGYKSGSYVSFLCLARLAHLVKERINTDPNINFGEAIRSFLNSSAMVQAKSVVTVSGQDAAVKSINIVYPPNFQEKAMMESNGYSGTQVKGKFSFSLPST